jgi:hypothetical protein
MLLEAWRVPCTATTDLPAVAETSARSFESLLQIFSMFDSLLLVSMESSMKELQEQAHPPFG